MQWKYDQFGSNQVNKTNKNIRMKTFDLTKEGKKII